MRSVTQLGAGAALLVLSAAQAAYADVVPTAPGPGEVFRVRSTCRARGRRPEGVRVTTLRREQDSLTLANLSFYML